MYKKAYRKWYDMAKFDVKTVKNVGNVVKSLFAYCLREILKRYIYMQNSYLPTLPTCAVSFMIKNDTA